MTNRKVHILTRERFGKLLLGPQIRLERLAQEFTSQGFEAFIYGHLCGNDFDHENRIKPLRPGFTKDIQPSDIVIASELLQARPCNELLSSNLRFHWDCYGLSLPETLSFQGTWPFLKSLADRRRKLVRYRTLASRAESVWVSNQEQGTFLAALLATSPSSFESNAASSFSKKTVLAPMGSRSESFPIGAPNPYPTPLHGRPIFLWGGGIWPWFDLNTVFDAMARTKDAPEAPCLFFISGRNEATSDYDAPLSEAISLAKSMELLDTNVFFNSGRVSSSELAPWLEHCTAGIMGSPATLESNLSWRTRYLDLLWAGRPLVASGDDPLARRMANEGAALVVEAGNGEGLAKSILQYASRRQEWLSACSASKRVAESTIWSKTLQHAVQRTIQTPPSRSRLPGVPPITKLRYVLGI